MIDQYLIGKRLYSATQAGPSDVLLWTDGGGYLLSCSPDCCSDAWVYGVENEFDGTWVKRGEKIVSVEEKGGPDLDEETSRPIWEKLKSLFGDAESQGSDETYEVVITGDKGSKCVIKHMNSSNGYYGSSIDLYKLVRVNWKSKEEVDKL